jgi:hypothetical protein
LPQVIAGEALGELIDALTTEHQAAQLAAQGARRERNCCRPCERGTHTAALLRKSTAHRCTRMVPRRRDDVEIRGARRFTPNRRARRALPRSSIRRHRSADSTRGSDGMRSAST